MREGRRLLTHPPKPDSSPPNPPRPPERTLRAGLEGCDSGWQTWLPVLSGTQLCGLVYKDLSIAFKIWKNAFLEAGAKLILPEPPL